MPQTTRTRYRHLRVISKRLRGFMSTVRVFAKCCFCGVSKSKFLGAAMDDAPPPHVARLRGMDWMSRHEYYNSLIRLHLIVRCWRLCRSTLAAVQKNEVAPYRAVLAAVPQPFGNCAFSSPSQWCEFVTACLNVPIEPRQQCNCNALRQRYARTQSIVNFVGQAWVRQHRRENPESYGS